MCLQCAAPRHLIADPLPTTPLGSGYGGLTSLPIADIQPRIGIVDIVALRGNSRVPDKGMQRQVQKLRGTRGVVTEVSGPYYAVTFADGASGEFTQDELIRVGPAVV